MRLIPSFGTKKTVDPNDPTSGQTLDALMLRQKQLLQQAPEAPKQIASPWQGAALLGNTLVNSLQQSRAMEQEKAGRDLMARTIAGINYDTGLTPEQSAVLMRLDPDTGLKFISDAITARREAAKPLTDVAKLNADLKAGRISQAEFDAQVSGGPAKLTDISSMRQDVISDPSYKNMATAAPIWSSIQDAATRDTPQAELNMVIGMAKLFDPTSVVRQGETETIANTGNLPASLTAAYKFLTAQPGGRLDPAVKAGLLQEGGSRMKGYYEAYKPISTFYKNLAVRHNVNPADVVYDFPDPLAGMPQPPQTDPAKTLAAEFKDSNLSEEQKAVLTEQNVRDTMSAMQMTREEAIKTIKQRFGIK